MLPYPPDVPGHRARRRPIRALLVLLVGITMLAGACSGGGEAADVPLTAPDTVPLPDRLIPTTTVDGGGEAPGTSAAPAPSGVVVDEFGVRAPLTCTRPSYDATVEWVARGAAAATVIVDGTQVAAPVPVEGPFVVTLPCDGVGHSVVLVVVGADGSRVIRTQAVLPGPQD